MRDRERLDPRVRVESAQQPPNVVADGVDAQVELLRDLRRRSTVREQVQDLVLAWSQVRVGVRRRRLLAVLDDAEHTDDPPAFAERARADLHLDALATRLRYDDGGVGRLLGPHHLAEERLPGLARVL